MENITDGKPKLANTFAHAYPMPVVTVADVKDADNGLNSYGYTVKSLGSVVMVDNGTARGLFMAVGELADSKWADLMGGDDLVPVYETAPNTNAIPWGDSKPKMRNVTLGSTDFPIVDSDKMTSVTPANVIGQSGMANMVIIRDNSSGKYALAITMDMLKWYSQDGSLLDTLTQPAPTPSHKPKLINFQVAAVPLTAVTEARLAEASDPVNAGDGVHNGLKDGAMLIGLSDTGVPKLYTSLAGKWIVASYAVNAGITPA